MPPKVFNNGLVDIRKNKVILTLNMCILELSKVLMYEFQKV